MKLKHIAIIALTMVAKTFIAQIIFYDAVKLRECINPSTNRFYKKSDDSAKVVEYLSILKKYTNLKDRTDVDPIAIYNYYVSATDDSKSNLFIKNLLPTSPTSSDVFGEITATSIKSKASGIISGIGATDITNIADGLAKFLVKRTKQELSIAFFEKFKDDLNKKELADLKILFPETWKTLNTIGEDIYQYSTYLNMLRESFAKDMSNQYFNLQKLLNQEKYKQYFLNTRPELGSILYSSLYFINKISTGVHPGEALAGYDINTINLCGTQSDCDADKKRNQINIRNSVKFLKILSASFQSKSTTDYWVPADSIQSFILQDTITFQIYMGLLYEKVKDINLKKSNDTSLTMGEIFNSVATHMIDSLPKYRNYIDAFTMKTQTINNFLIDVKGKTKSERDYNDYHTLFNASLELLDHTRTFTELPYVNLGNLQEERIRSISDHILYVSKSAGELYVDVNTKNYSSAIIDIISILDTVANYNQALKSSQIKLLLKKNEKWFKDHSGLTSVERENLLGIFSAKITIPKQVVGYLTIKPLLSVLSPTLILKINNTKALQDSLVTYFNLLVTKNEKELREKILKYGTFIAVVAQAKSSDEVEAAIESIALPSGSARIKRESRFNISLNAYCGLYAGAEREQFLYEEDGGIVNSYGLTAPIGVAFSWGSHLTDKYHASHSLFLSVVDVGAIASFRFQNDSVRTLSKIELKDIISPGAFYSFGIPRLPLSVNVGYQITPFLRNTGATNNTFKPSYHRISVGIVVDIPLLNFHTRSR